MLAICDLFRFVLLVCTIPLPHACYSARPCVCIVVLGLVSGNGY